MKRSRLVGLVSTHTAGGVLAVGMPVAELTVNGATVNQWAPTMILLISALATGWLLAVKLPRNPLGWMLMGIAAWFVSGWPFQALAQSLRATDPGAAAWCFWFGGTATQPSWAWVPPMWALLVWVPLHFPNGRTPSRRWRWFTWATTGLLVYACAVFATGQGPIGGLANPMAVPRISGVFGQLILLAALALALCFVGTIVSLVVRYRSGSSLVRAQLRWMVWAAAASFALFLVSFVLPAGPLTDLYDDWLLAAVGVIPVAIAIAVLRYRLYEIDRLISRTAAYAFVTLVVVGTYALVVLLVGLLPGLQSFGVALATLAAAAVFLPVLRWVRHWIDRVFDRAQYNAEKVVVTFGERIRNGADPHTAGADLLGAVAQTLQPTAIGLWVREDAR